MSEKEIYMKMLRFCTYRERCVSEATEKLKKLGARGKQAEQILEKLSESGFLSDERFARIYTGSRFRIKYWGRLKIRFELKKKGISEKLIQDAADEEIDFSEYVTTLRKLLNRKSRNIKEENSLLRKQKLTSYALGKGYEPDIIREVLG